MNDYTKYSYVQRINRVPTFGLVLALVWLIGSIWLMSL